MGTADLPISFIMTGAEVFVALYFYLQFLGHRINPLVTALLAALCVCLTVTMPDSAWVQFAVFLLFLCAVGFFICRVHSTLTVLYALIIAEVMQLTFGVFNSALTLLFPYANSAHRPETGTLFMLLGYLAIPLAAVCYHALGKFFSSDNAANNPYILLILIPTLLISLTTQFVDQTFYGNTLIVTGGYAYSTALEGLQTFEVSEVTEFASKYWQLLGIQLLDIASLFCIVYAYKKLVESFHLRVRLSSLEQQERYLDQYVSEAKSRYEKTRSFRHDITNHIAVVSGLLEEDKVEQAASYLSDMTGMAEEMSFSYSTNNPALDVLMANKLGNAKEDGIDVICDLKLPSHCTVRDIDLAVVLSNALDNALYACSLLNPNDARYIRVSSKLQRSFLLLEVENSCAKNAHFQKGTGLANIETVAEKYSGAVTIENKNGIFLLSVLLIMPSDDSKAE